MDISEPTPHQADNGDNTTDGGAKRLAMTASAVSRVEILLEGEKMDRLMLRVSVTGGGCSGFQYGFSFDDAVNGDDTVFDQGGVKMVVDECSLDLIANSEIDWVETLAGASFQIKNPQRLVFLRLRIIFLSLNSI